MASLNERIASLRAWGRTTLDHWRVRRLWIDHLVRAVRRYQLQGGDRLAGSVTYFSFLSFFPLLALGYAVLGYTLDASSATRKALETAINERLPGMATDLNLEQIAGARTTAGIIGLLGLLYAGLGAMDALRAALREMSMTTVPPPNYFLGKLRDLVSVILLGATLVVSTLVSGAATTVTDKVLDHVFGDNSLLSTEAFRIFVLVASVVADWVLFVILLGWVAKPAEPFKVIVRGALLGAIGFGLLKQVASLLLSTTLSNPVYGAFAAIVGLLVWMNFSARLVLLAAAWTSTTGLCPPPSPSPIPSIGDPLEVPAADPRQAAGPECRGTTPHPTSEP
ncbi:YihY/virulence factor BrkB family protein [Nonomuraea sp. NPDC001636]|uniref:YihY/virulence factor BrkB family protein n=1 Tax=Nonomuraea sp. NPDC001636 TaxID=3154391 RepID=UPI00332E12E1